MINYYFKMHPSWVGHLILKARLDDTSKLYPKHLKAVQHADYIWMEVNGKVTYLKDRSGKEEEIDPVEFAEIKLSAIDI